MQIREQGWECPKCSRIWAPKISACGACNDRQTLPPYIGTPHRPDFYQIGAPISSEWNFTADDQSFVNRPGVEL